MNRFASDGDSRFRRIAFNVSNVGAVKIDREASMLIGAWRGYPICDKGRGMMNVEYSSGLLHSDSEQLERVVRVEVMMSGGGLIDGFMPESEAIELANKSEGTP